MLVGGRLLAGVAAVAIAAGVLVAVAIVPIAYTAWSLRLIIAGVVLVAA